ncbi:unnamed protein product [Cuscuta campestris]|uniref:ERCC4 domain-containing protein n=1 Tax=Cuscuta campestris TaxID=132261 RepID=A0A484M2B5_9ASTE|nr:unnamed protein product [Cuscuta campestris]
MPEPVAVELSDSDDDRRSPDGDSRPHDTIDLSTPLAFILKKQRTALDSNPTVFVIDDEHTPETPALGLTASASIPSFVPETPFSGLSKQDLSMIKFSNFSSPILNAGSSGPSFVEETPIHKSRLNFWLAKCTKGVEGPQNLTSSVTNIYKSSGTNGLICLDSDSESDDISKFESQKSYDRIGFTVEMEGGTKVSSRICHSTCLIGNTNIVEASARDSKPTSFQSDAHLVQKSIYCHHCNTDLPPSPPTGDRSAPSPLSLPAAVAADGDQRLCEETDGLEPFIKALKPKSKNRDNSGRGNKIDEARERKKILKDEQLRLKDEKKLQKEQEKMLKAAQKAEAAEMKKVQKEKQKWEKGKFALKSIVALIDTRIVELGPIGGHLITRLAENGISYRITSNPIEKSILWTMGIPEQLSQIPSEPVDIKYVLLLYEAEEFCNLVLNGYLLDHASNVRSLYPLHQICYLTNKLMAYINKREQCQYKDPANSSCWKRPPIEEVLAKLATQFVGVHSRQCIDEAEVAEHVLGLTCNLAICQYRKKLSRLSINANGSLVPKDCADKDLIKKSTWLKALLAIPKVQPRFAIAIGKKYPTMKSLLIAYMDPNISVHEKEFLLSDLRIEGLLGDNRRLGEICSKRVYRILMAQSGGLIADDIESGSDFFGHHKPVGLYDFDG